MPSFQFLNQETYKDDDGRDVAASEVEFIAPYQHLIDGFYKWECGACRNEHGSRSCGWPIAGQVLKCEGCNVTNLLVKTNTVQLDEIVSKQNTLNIELEQLARDRAAFDAEVNRATETKLRSVEMPLRTLLAEIERSNGRQQAT